MRIFAVGGGSGGHVTPILAVIEELYHIDENVEVRIFCDRTFSERARGLMKKAPINVKVTTIIAGKLRRYKHISFWRHLTTPTIMLANVIDVFKVGVGFFQSIVLLAIDRPDVVFAKGGFVSLPFGLAAHILRIPLVIHDSDMRPGLTNRILARYAAAIGAGAPLEYYPTYPHGKTRHVGVPIAREFSPVNTRVQRAYKTELGFASDEILVVALGGSLGASSINQSLCGATTVFDRHAINVYLVSGERHYEDVVDIVPQNSARFKVVPFVHQGIHKMMAAADVVISRASATTLQELAALRKPAIIVPGKQLGDQLKNADAFAAKRAAVIMHDDELDEELANTIISLAADSGERKRLSTAIAMFYKPGAAKAMAQTIIHEGQK